MLNILFLALLNIWMALAQLNCDNVFITSINLTAIQVSNFINSSYDISLNSSDSQYYIDELSNITISGLCPETNYTVTFSNIEDTCVVYHKITGTIENLTIDSINATTTRVSWNRLFCGGSYTVTYRNSSYDIAGDVGLNDSDDYNVSAIVTHLCPQILYEFIVTLEVEDQQCSKFSIQQLVYISNEKLTGVVTNFSDHTQVNKSAPIGNNNSRIILQFYWELPEFVNCYILQYRITLSQQDVQEVSSAAYDNLMGNNNRYILSSNGVFPNTMYTIVIIPVTIAGDGEELMINIVTPIDIPWDVPQNFQIYSNGQAVAFNWTSPNTPNVPITDISYNITITREDGNVTSMLYSYLITSGSFSDLNWYEKVCANIVAYNQKGSGPPSLLICTYTSESKSGPVTNLMYSVLNHHSIIVSWDPPLTINGNLMQYEVVLRYSDSTTIIQQWSVNNGSMIQIDNLDIKSSYSVTVIPVNGAGDGDQNNISTYSSQDKLPVLLELTTTRISNNSFQLTWVKPDNFKGVIFRYNLEYRPRQTFTSNKDTTEVIIQSNQTSYIVNGIDTYILYNIKMTAITNQGIETAEIISYPVSNRSLNNTQGNILQLRMYGNTICSQDNKTTIKYLLIQGLSEQLSSYCNCDTTTAYENVQLLCNNDANSIILRTNITQAATIEYVLTWLNSPYPFILFESNILLVDTSLVCSYLITDIDGPDCNFRSDESDGTIAKNNCNGVIVGTFFGASLFGGILATVILLLIIHFCNSCIISGSEFSHEIDTNKSQRTKRWTSPFQLHHKPNHTYENVTSLKPKSNLKLNPLPAGDPLPETTEMDDIYTNEDDIIEMRRARDEVTKRFPSLQKSKVTSAPEIINSQTVSMKKKIAKGENKKLELNSSKTLLSVDKLHTPTVVENENSNSMSEKGSSKDIKVKPVAVHSKIHVSKNESSSEYVNVKRKPEIPKVNVPKLAPEVKPKPKVALTRKIDMQLNESYKPSTRDDSNARIQAVVLSSKMGHHSHQ